MAKYKASILLLTLACVILSADSTNAGTFGCVNGGSYDGHTEGAFGLTLTWHQTGSCYNPCTNWGWTAPNGSQESVSGDFLCDPEYGSTNYRDAGNFNMSTSGLGQAWSYWYGMCMITDTAVSSINCSCSNAECSPTLPPPSEESSSPVLISVSDQKIELTSRTNGVSFDLDADGLAETIAWTAAEGDDGFLVLDRNENGSIDNGIELFGNHTPQLPSEEPNGYLALALWDDSLNGGNEDGVIDSADQIFFSLQIWIDSNHNGHSESGELWTLSDLGISAIELDHSRAERQDRWGNEFRFKGKARAVGGELKMTWDVFFASTQ